MSKELKGYLESQHGLPCVRAISDCLTFVEGWLNIHGKSIAELGDMNYKTLQGGLRAIRAAGGETVEDLADMVMQRTKHPKIGDIASIRQGAHVTGCLAIYLGDNVCALFSDAGMVFTYLDTKVFWSVS